MPNVAGVEFPYTPEGERAAFEAQRELDELLRGATYARPGSPLGGTPWERQDQQRIEDIKRQFRFGLEDRYQTDPRTDAVMLDEFGQPFRGESISQQTPGWQQPMTQAPRGQTTRTTEPGAGYGQRPSGPTAQMPTRQPQAPRQNVTEQFSVPANYGSSPSNPNWGAERGGLRPIGRMGPVGSDIGRETVRQRQQPTFRDVSHRPQDWKEQMLDKLRGVSGSGGGVSGRPITQPKQPTFSSVSHRPTA